MDLSDQQVQTIKDRAGKAGVIEKVHLFGSRAKGCARPDSDVDLAITTGIGHYVRFANEWVVELSEKLGLKAHLKQYNCPADDRVKGYCDEYGIVLFPSTVPSFRGGESSKEPHGQCCAGRRP
jgi:predicted nucleotidyltransferase